MELVNVDARKGRLLCGPHTTAVRDACADLCAGLHSIKYIYSRSSILQKIFFEVTVKAGNKQDIFWIQTQSPGINHIVFQSRNALDSYSSVTLGVTVHA